MSVGRLHHVALWVRDLERMRHFYEAVLGATSGSRYDNPRTGFQTYFMSFSEGARVELMSQASRGEPAPSVNALGYAHIALALGGRAVVDEAIARLRSLGVVVLREPRTTGDGYSEAVVEDPEGYRIELVE